MFSTSNVNPAPFLCVDVPTNTAEGRSLFCRKNTRYAQCPLWERCGVKDAVRRGTGVFSATVSFYANIVVKWKH